MEVLVTSVTYSQDMAVDGLGNQINTFRLDRHGCGAALIKDKVMRSVCSYI